MPRHNRLEVGYFLWILLRGFLRMLPSGPFSNSSELGFSPIDTDEAHSLAIGSCFAGPGLSQSSLMF